VTKATGEKGHAAPRESIIRLLGVPQLRSTQWRCCDSSEPDTHPQAAPIIYNSVTDAAYDRAMTGTTTRLMASHNLDQARHLDPDAFVEMLGDILISKGQCDRQTLDRGQRVASESGQRIDMVMLKLGLVTERGLAEAYAELLEVPVAAPDRYPQTPLLPDRLRPVFLRNARALPVGIENDVLKLAVADGMDAFTPCAVEAAVGLKVERIIAVPLELEAALRRLYPERKSADAGDSKDGEALEQDAERLKDLASEAPVIRLVNQLIGRAVETRASDMHVEPFEDRLRVRYRYDGVLHETDSHPARLAPAIISRIKIMSKLDIAERRLPQDGRIKMPVRGTEVDFRVSTTPTLWGEKLVLRILDRSSVVFDYEKLGLPQNVVTAWSKALDLPNGILLVTGPTGSGKTTTLYTGLTQINATARNIVTVEDPIEYQLAGINQTQIKPQIGLSFAAMLRSILRQDPDVIMVGEIRDLETAQIAVQAALTGHLVLSTLHTNSASATITRLRDLGLEDYLLTAVLRGVLAQRLVRRLCNACKRPSPAPEELVERLGLRTHGRTGPVTLWHPVGCEKCRGTGYRGRQALAEFLLPHPAINHLIFSRACEREIERVAVENGMVTMFRAGLEAALNGTTTIEEVVRSVWAET
jgi:general secretion pathway protein E